MTISQMLRRATFAAILGSSVLAAASETDDSTVTRKWSYIPEFHGVMRAFYELSTANGQSRFDVKNARLSAGGFILPKVDYFLQVDFCNMGKITLLDAYARVEPLDGLKLYAGQMRVPFSVESSRKPQDYHFANVGLVARLGNLRSVGVKAGYTVPRFPLYIEGGVFNGTDRSNHAPWNSQLTYGIKANVKAGGFKPEVAFMSRVAGGQDGTPRFNQGNVSLSWTNGDWFIEGEYIHRSYTDGTSDEYAYDFFIDRGWDVNWKWARRLSAQARFDGISETVDGREHKRLTVGATARYSYRSIFLDFRINFEQYFYEGGTAGVSPDANNTLLAGLILYF